MGRRVRLEIGRKEIVFVRRVDPDGTEVAEVPREGHEAEDDNAAPQQ